MHTCRYTEFCYKHATEPKIIGCMLFLVFSPWKKDMLPQATEFFKQALWKCVYVKNC